MAVEAQQYLRIDDPGQYLITPERTKDVLETAEFHSPEVDGQQLGVTITSPVERDNRGILVVKGGQWSEYGNRPMEEVRNAQVVSTGHGITVVAVEGYPGMNWDLSLDASGPTDDQQREFTGLTDGSSFRSYSASVAEAVQLAVASSELLDNDALERQTVVLDGISMGFGLTLALASAVKEHVNLEAIIFREPADRAKSVSPHRIWPRFLIDGATRRGGYLRQNGKKLNNIYEDDPSRIWKRRGLHWDAVKAMARSSFNNDMRHMPEALERFPNLRTVFLRGERSWVFSEATQEEMLAAFGQLVPNMPVRPLVVSGASHSAQESFGNNAGQLLGALVHADVIPPADSE